MRIGLIADTHIPEARDEVWPQVFDAFGGVDAILHAGDVYELQVVDQLSAVAPTYVARGNGDDGSGGRPVQPTDGRCRELWQLELGGLKIAMTHVWPIPEIEPHHTVARFIDRLMPEFQPDVVIYGDTHVEHISTVDGILCVNPGSPTLPHNLTVELGTIGFLDIDDGVPDASIWRLTDDGIEPFDWDTWRRPW